MDVSRIITLRENEKVVMVVRNFWPLHLSRVLLGATLLVLTAFFSMPLFRFGTVGIVAFVILVFLGLWSSLRSLVIWYWNVFIITTQRVVDVNQRGYFKREVSEANFEKIQDVLYSINGVFRSLFNFGVVRMQTAGNGMALELSDVPDPKRIHHVITESMSRFEGSNRKGARDKVNALLETVSELSDAEAKAFLVSLQKAVKRDGQTALKESKSRRQAVQEWAKRDNDRGGLFREDVTD